MPRLLRVADAVDCSGLSERQVRRLIASGRLAAIRPSGIRVVLVAEDELFRLLREPTRTSVDTDATAAVP